MNLEKILENLKKETKKSTKGKFSQLILFGSYARNEENTFSDLDLLLLVKEPLTMEEKEKINEIASKFTLKYDIVFSIIDYPEIFYEKYNSPFLLNVKEEGKRI